MPTFEILEFIALIIILIPLSFTYYILKKRRDLFPLLPGACFLILSYIFTNLEAVAVPEFFNFMEHFSTLIGGVLFFLGVIAIFNRKSPEKPQTQQQGMVTK